MLYPPELRARIFHQTFTTGPGGPEKGTQLFLSPLVC